MLTINARPFEPLIYQLCELSGHLDPKPPVWSTIDAPNRAPLRGTTVTVSPREIRLGCDIRPPTLGARMLLMDTIKRRLGGLLELRTDDLPGRYLVAEFVDTAVEFYPGDYAVVACYLTITLRALDPARWEDVPLRYGLSTARTVCPVGTEASAPDVWVYGACTDPEIVVRDWTGAEVSRTRFTVTLGSNDILHLAGGALGGVPGAITHRVSGVVQTNALATYRDGALPLLAPEDADQSGAVGPSVELSSASGTPTGLIHYVRRW